MLLEMPEDRKQANNTETHNKADYREITLVKIPCIDSESYSEVRKSIL